MKINSSVRLLMALIFLGLTFTSCVPSQIYNPTLDLASKPLGKGDFSISGRYGYAPESRTKAVNSKVNLMGAASLKYGITDKISITAEGWTEFSKDKFFSRGGYAFSVPFLLNEGERISWQLIPKYGFTVQGSWAEGNPIVDGHGFSLAAAAYLNTNRENNFHPYFGFTGLYAFNEFGYSKIINDELKEARYPMGLAAMVHLGLNYECFDWLNLNVELPIIYQYSSYDRQHDLLPVPSIGFSLVF